MPASELPGDQRAVEGMPIRLVVAVTVGAAAFGLLVPMADSVEQASETEITAEPDRQQLAVGQGEDTTVTVDVVTTDGKPVNDASVLVTGRSLSVPDGPLRFEPAEGESSVTLAVGTDESADVTVDFRPTQNRGTISVDPVAPPGTDYTDEMANPELTVRKP